MQSIQHLDERFIPAGAGNTYVALRATTRCAVHPRRRGEHKALFLILIDLVGSSPQARGTQAAVRICGLGIRFIPAGAGNTLFSIICHKGISVHPRRRGEHHPPPLLRSRMSGSSPQARGTRLANSRCEGDGRFIPAGAGNTQNRRQPALRLPVHPRRRGEHEDLEAFALEDDGSSPQARGTPAPALAKPEEVRFIPAGAGNTEYNKKGRMIVSVHPRRRGEHLNCLSRNFSVTGSSPQARGTPEEDARDSGSDRFIPAGAGNT